MHLKTFIIFFTIIFANHLLAQSQVRMFTANQIPADLKHETLYIELFEKLNSDDVFFDEDDVNTEELSRFLKKHNRNITSSNRKIQQYFFKYYMFSSTALPPETINASDSNDYRYVLKTEVVKIETIKGTKIKQEYLSFNHYIYDREKAKRLGDMKVYSQSYWKELREIIDLMNDYLLEENDL